MRETTLAGDWRNTQDSSEFVRATIQGTSLRDFTNGFTGDFNGVISNVSQEPYVISDFNSNSFRIDGGYGGGQATYTSNKISWANGAIYVRSKALHAHAVAHSLGYRPTYRFKSKDALA